MSEQLLLQLIDRFVKPDEWFEITDFSIDGYCLIGSKEDQRVAGINPLINKERQPVRARTFGLNPVKPYRDYYGKFTLTTRLEPHPLEVKFAIGYTINTKVVTIDDYSNFGWLRMATGVAGIVYPNLADQKQLLEYLMSHSKYPRFIVTRVYHYLQNEMYRRLTASISA